MAEEERFELVRDENSGDWYMLPLGMLDKWNKFLDSNAYEEAIYPTWAKEVDLSTLTFTNPA